jgi:hypothetical protein
METPIHGIRFIHRAILVEAARLEQLAGEGAADVVQGRLPFFRKVLHLHNHGEELGLFPDIAARLPDVVPSYLLDHREEERLFADLLVAATAGGTPLIRATTAVATHLRLHIKKEEELIVPLVDRLFAPPEQGAQVGKMLSRFTPADFTEVLPWLVTALEPEDRRTYLGLMEKVSPADRFAGMLGMIRDGVTPDVWATLGR